MVITPHAMNQTWIKQPGDFTVADTADEVKSSAV